MKTAEGVPIVKFMMLLSSMAPLFILIGIRGLNNVISDVYLWSTIGLMVGVPHAILAFRLVRTKISNDTYTLNVKKAINNKEYLFTYLFTVLLPLYSVSTSSIRDIWAISAAICFVLFVLWNMNLHFINLMFALMGYKVFILEEHNNAILLTKRIRIIDTVNEIQVYRLSNSVFIELN